MIEGLFPIDAAIAWGETVNIFRALFARHREPVAPENPVTRLPATKVATPDEDDEQNLTDRERLSWR